MTEGKRQAIKRAVESQLWLETGAPSHYLLQAIDRAVDWMIIQGQLQPTSNEDRELFRGKLVLELDFNLLLPTRMPNDERDQPLG